MIDKSKIFTIFSYIFIIYISLLVIIFITGIFLIEKVNFPSPEKKYDIDVTNDIKKL